MNNPTPDLHSGGRSPPVGTPSAEPDLFTVPQVCAQLPGRGSKRVHPSTVTRWILTGCPALDGLRVKLAATRCGARWLVAPADLAAFFAALGSTVRPPAPAPCQRRSPAQRERASAAAVKTLKGMGA